MGRKQKSTDIEVAEALRRDTIAEPSGEIARLGPSEAAGLLVRISSPRRARRADLRLQLANGKFDYTIGTEFTRQSAWGVSGNSMGVYFSMPLPIFNRNQGEIARAQREINLGRRETSASESFHSDRSR